MPKSLKKDSIEPCDRHELEGRAWDWDFDRGACLRCIKDQVDVLWDLESKRGKKNDPKSR